MNKRSKRLIEQKCGDSCSGTRFGEILLFGQVLDSRFGKIIEVLFGILANFNAIRNVFYIEK